ncbi:MAG: hypothetical protein V3S89_09455 [Desulfobacterales bacterium]
MYNGEVMIDNDHIQSLLKEAEVYHRQGLLDESKVMYQSILDIGKTDETLSGDAHFIEMLNGKMQAVDDMLAEIDSEPDTVELTEDQQDLVSRLYAFSNNEDTAAVESAVALAAFGQYEKAVSEFQELLDKNILPMTVAKNMLQCHITLATHDVAIAQLQDWISDNAFTGNELGRLHDFLEDILERDGIEADLPPLAGASPGGNIAEAYADNVSEADISEILSVKVIFDDKHMKGQVRDFDTLFQLGNSVTIDIKNSEKDLLNILETGVYLQRIQCYAAFYFFNARGLISEKKVVTTGPKQGHYSVVLRLENP